MSETNQPPQGLVASLQRSLAWLDTAMDGLADGLVIAREDGRLRWANRSFSRSCGVESCVTLVDRPLVDLLGPWRPADAASDWSLLPLPPGPEGEEGVIQLQRQHAGDRHWLELHWRRLSFRDSVQLIFTLRDITLAVQAERARRQEEDLLRQQLEQERAFAQAMAHELRTPLAIASLELQCLARELPGPEARIAAIHHELDRMARLLERVSWLNSLQLQQSPASAAPESMAIAPLLGRWFRAIDRLPDDTLQVQGTAEEMTQLLRELQQNALRFGGAEPRLSVADDGPWLQLLVHTGSTGLPEADLSRIFERFVKLDHHRQDGRPEGSGLGLPIARSLARRMGGELSAVNDDTGRLCFRLSLRIAQPA